MSQETRYFRLGLFVLITLALFVAGVVIFGAGKMFETRIKAETSISESAAGLDVGADLRYQGVSVGRVSSIQLGGTRAKEEHDIAKRLALGKLVIIGLEFYPKSLPPVMAKSPRAGLEGAVQAGLRARIASSGITGPTYMELLLVEQANAGDTAAPYPTDLIYIPSTPSFVSGMKLQLETFLEHVNEMKLAETVDSARALLDDLRKSVGDVQVKRMNDSIVTTLDKAQAAVDQVNALLNSPEIKASLKNVEQMTAHAKDITASPDIQKVLADLPRISGDLTAASEQIKAITENPAIHKTLEGTANVGPAVADLRRALRELSDILTSNRTDIDVMLANLRRTAVNTAELTDDAKGNPARILFGEPPPKRDGR